MKKSTILPALVIAALAFSSCNKDKESPEPIKSPKHDYSAGMEDVLTGEVDYTASCEATVVDFMAGQHNDAGNITISNDSDYVYVTFETEGDWLINHTHLYVGSYEGLPKNKKGNPKIGNFPYQSGHEPLETSFTYGIPMEAVGDDSCFVVATHAEVVKYNGETGETQEETAWGAGPEITEGGSWAMYTEYCLCEESQDDNNDDLGDDDDIDNDNDDDSGVPPIQN